MLLLLLWRLRLRRKWLLGLGRRLRRLLSLWGRGRLQCLLLLGLLLLLQELLLLRGQHWLLVRLLGLLLLIGLRLLVGLLLLMLIGLLRLDRLLLLLLLHHASNRTGNGVAWTCGAEKCQRRVQVSIRSSLATC